ncbi:alpha-L-arabinofuranosidase C-terminal domain-containing protein [Butyrivibrio sp. NC3005]|uniref:alpha-L-arabinofuranosidase C-terminal domain-containing protein n=1 Tax=Butyrivibrio sp. NC3005 TaxID=1280685 RepID=UPI00041E5624|nr:alpha-L-arabinofuranosidase C-terminal domain-containing protein [Butyrivibrio sp. NC3005]
MGQEAKITVHPSFEIGEISNELFSAFLEPIGTMVNGTMFNPKHPTADDQGFRTDFIDALKKTDLPAVRMPGGNFVSAWQWKDSIGPKSERKVHLDPAWHQYITNEVGHDEYLQWAEKVGTKPLYTVNMGTGSIQDAMDLVEYTNHEGGTYWSDLRKKNGHEAPYNVKTWYLGNEMDGPWQLGAWDKNPEAYGCKVLETSKAIKWIDESIKTGVCGSSAPFMEGFPAWDEAVLDKCYDVVDYVSVHHYHSAPQGDIKSLLGGSLYYEDFINTEVAMIDYVASKHRSPKKVMLSFDEYGAMVRPLQPLHPGYGRYNMARSHYHFDPERRYILHDPDNMNEREFPGGDMLQALSMASIQLALLRHADRVKIGCMTGGLYALAAANHDHVWNSASHYIFMHLLKYAKGLSLTTKVSSETYDMPGYAIEDTSQYTGKEGVNFIDAASAWDKDNNRLTVFAINRNEESSYPLTIDVKGFEDYKVVSAFKMKTDDLNLKNSFGNDTLISPESETVYTFDNGELKINIEPLSWNVYVFEAEKP